jgi:drug/metabolite transporter (DMT)-like permease
MQLNFNKNQSFFTPLIFIAPFFLWGTAMVAMKGIIFQTTPLFMAGIRIFPAGILILIVAAILKLPQPKTWLGWLWIGLFALIDGMMFQGFLGEGLVKTTAGLGSVMIDSQPLAVAILSRWLFAEIIGLWGWFGLGIGIMGISLIGIQDELLLSLFNENSVDIAFSLTNVFNNGEFLMLLASLSMAIGTVMIPYVSRYVDPVVATGWHLIIGGAGLFLLSSVNESQQWQNIELSGWLSLTYATVFGSAIAYGLFFYLASKGNLTSLSALTFLTPIFALTFGNLLLGEILSSIQWIGVFLTLISIYLINQRENITKQISACKNMSNPQSLILKERISLVKNDIHLK